MSTANSQRITSRVVLALVLVLLAWALSGCGSGAAGRKTAEGGSATASSTPAAKRAYGFDLAGTLAGVPGNSKRTAVKLAWFPPDGTDGLRPFLDQQQLVALTQAAMTSPQFWLLPSADSTAPIVFGDAARKAVTEHGEFTGGTIVPIVPVVHALKVGKTAPFDSLFGKPTGYQVYLEGPAGVTSFSMVPTTKPGEWSLDSRGELLNWSKSIDALGRNVGFVATKAAVTHTAFGVEGKRAVVLTWALFTDARGRVVVAALRDLPPTSGTWAIGGEPLHSGAIYPFASIFTTVTATPGP